MNSELRRWGPSAGAISVSLQMLTNGGDTEGLFRAAIMHSGSPVPTGYTDSQAQQAQYDAIVDMVGCSGSEDTLECLRQAPADAMVAAGSALPGTFDYSVSKVLMAGWSRIANIMTAM